MDQLTNGNPQIAALAKAVRKRADYLGEEAFAQQDDISGNLYRLARDVAELGRVLANIIEGKPLDRAFGAPGDWGYDHPIGQALAACYVAKPEPFWITRIAAGGSPRLRNPGESTEDYRIAMGWDQPHAVQMAEGDLAEMRKHGNADDATEAAAHLERARHEQGGCRTVLERIARIEIERGMDGNEAIERGIAAVGYARQALASGVTVPGHHTFSQETPTGSRESQA
jgi:hypothetical protein